MESSWPQGNLKWQLSTCKCSPSSSHSWNVALKCRWELFCLTIQAGCILILLSIKLLLMQSLYQADSARGVLTDLQPDIQYKNTTVRHKVTIGATTFVHPRSHWKCFHGPSSQARSRQHWHRGVSSTGQNRCYSKNSKDSGDKNI